MIALDSLSRPQQALFILLKASIRDKAPEENFFSFFSESEWKEVYRLAIEHGIMAFVFDSVMRLSDEQKPPRSLKMSWAVSVDAVENRYAKQASAAHDLAAFFKENNISMLLFKGLSIAQYYSIPSHREFGDLDIYLYGKYEEGNKLLVRLGSKKNHNDAKHTALIYKSVPVENHTNFLTLHRYSHLGNLENRLLKLCEESLNENLSDSILFPTPDFSALFMICHTIIHFPSSFVIRNLCDWVVFLESNKGKIDFINYKKALSQAGLTNISDAISSLAVRLFDLDPDSTPDFISDPDLEDKILLDMLNPFVLRKNNPSVWEILKYKFRLLKYRRWKYELVNPKGYNRFILNSIFFYFLHPGLIIQLRRVEK